MRDKLFKWVTIATFNIGVNIIGLPLIHNHNVLLLNRALTREPKSKFIGNKLNNFKR